MADSIGLSRARIVLRQRQAELDQAMRELDRREKLANISVGYEAAEELEQYQLKVAQAIAARDLALLDVQEVQESKP